MTARLTQTEREERVRWHEEWMQQRREERAEATRRKQAWRQEQLDVPCPASSCRARIGRPCKCGVNPHVVRQQRHRAVRGVGWDAVLAVSCGLCGAEPRAVCVTPQGAEYNDPHAVRVQAARDRVVVVDPRPDAVLLAFRTVVAE